MPEGSVPLERTRNGGSVPVPDPTTLTTAIVTEAKADLRREAASLRELLETRMNGIDTSLSSISDEVRAEMLVRTSSIDGAIDHLANLHGEKFAAIGQQFAERDVRAEQDKKASKEALDAALLAQKESVRQQNDANTTAATKSEASFTKQIDLVGNRIDALDKSWTDRFTELKERIDRGEGKGSGEQDYRTEARLDQGISHQVVGLETSRRQLTIASIAAGLSAIVAVIAVIALVVHG